MKHYIKKKNVNKKVLLISMPWAPTPHLGLSTLKSVLMQKGVACTLFEASMEIYNFIDYKTANYLGSLYGINEFLFTYSFEKEISEEQLHLLPWLYNYREKCIDRFCQQNEVSSKKIIKNILWLRNKVIPDFLKTIETHFNFKQYCMVGFTCSYNQIISSIAMAKKIKRENPECMIVFGGQAISKPTGLALQNSFPEVEVINYGDGEPNIFPLYQASIKNISLKDITNISFRNEQGDIIENRETPGIDMDKIPIPNFDDYFTQRKRLQSQHGIKIKISSLPIESSRGCWWARKSQCVFCGTNHRNTRYRVKDSKILTSQLEELNKKYKINSFYFADEIMPQKYFSDFLPYTNKKYKLHYEMRSDLSITQIRNLSLARVSSVFLGIESFSTSILNSIRKGTTAFQNISTIKNFNLHHIFPTYLLIYGFPGEKPEDYAEMCKLIPSLHHLTPPKSLIPLSILRYSPLLEEIKKSEKLEPHRLYDVIFSSTYKNDINLEMLDICYYFNNPYTNHKKDMERWYDKLQFSLNRWKDEYDKRKAQLSFSLQGNSLIISDLRNFKKPCKYNFGKIAGEISRMLQDSMNIENLITQLATKGYSPDDCLDELTNLIKIKIVLKQDDNLLWLALPERNQE